VTLVVETIQEWNEPVTLRLNDERECNLVSLSGAEAVMMSVANSTCAYVVRVNGLPLAWFGFRANPISAVADVWMLTTPLADEWPLMVARGSQRVITGILELAPTLSAIVDARHAPARKWLRWLGFKEYPMRGGLINMTLEKKDWQWAS
jgi:hypothetical protein